MRESIATRSPVKGHLVHRVARGPAAAASDIARYYDLDVEDERADIDMYLALAAASDGPVLELACGSGRICLPLAAAGHDVTGVDIDPEMLDRAREAWSDAAGVLDNKGPDANGSLTLRHGDATEITLSDRFDLVILGFNSLLVMGDGDASAQRAVLANMHRHLTRDGRAVIDTWLPTADDLALYDGRLIHEWTRLDPSTGEQVSKTTSATYEPGSRRATIDTFFDAWHEGEPPRRTSRRDLVHFPTRQMLMEMVEAAGLSPQIVAGDYDMSPLEDDSDRVIVVAAPATGTPASQIRRQRRYSRVVAGSPASDATLRLLLVEDMPQVANYIRSLLDAQSKVKLLDVITDGREVAEQVRELQPDLLIVDALLQGKMNGLQVAMDLREAGLNVPIIALTVPTKPIAVGEGMGSTRILSMPFSGYDFMHLVQELHRRTSRPGA